MATVPANILQFLQHVESGTGDETISITLGNLPVDVDPALEQASLDPHATITATVWEEISVPVKHFMTNMASEAQKAPSTQGTLITVNLLEIPQTRRPINWNAVPKKIKDFIVEHPYQTTFYVINGVVFVVPFALAGPLLAAAGFTAAGPAAGSIAAGAQSALSPVVAGGGFATLQSAAMGGYGAATVAGVTQAGSAVGSAVVGAWNYLRGRNSREGEGEGQGRESDEEGDEKKKPGDGEGDVGEPGERAEIVAFYVADGVVVFASAWFWASLVRD